jgi:hypothetical protein
VTYMKVLSLHSYFNTKLPLLKTYLSIQIIIFPEDPQVGISLAFLSVSLLILGNELCI